METKVALMKSKAGRRFAGFMKAYNTGDPDVIYDFVKQYTTDEALQAQPVKTWAKQLITIYQHIGTMKVEQVVAADEYRVVVVMGAQAGGLYTTELAVSEDYPHKVAEFKHEPTG